MAEFTAPVSIKIGPVVYKVETVKDLHMDDEDKTPLNGQIVYEDQTIQLEADLNPDYAQIVLLHETLHGVLYQAGLTIDMTDEKEEALIMGLSFGLVDLLRSNPLLCRSIITV